MFVCKEYEARISALIDDELTAEERIEVLEHIAKCPACKAYWEGLLTLRDALREETPAPAGFADAVMSRVRDTAQETAAAEKKTVRFPGWKRFAGLAACCALVAIGVWMADILPTPSMDTASVRNGAAPEAAPQNDCTDDSVMADTDAGAESYGYTDSANDAASFEAPASCGETPEVQPEDDFIAAITTSSEVAKQWVEDVLGKEWVSGARYSISEEQYLELYKLLSSSGESFTEIIGNYDGSSYQLLAE